MGKLKDLLSVASPVQSHSPVRRQHHCIHGSGRVNLGVDCTCSRLHAGSYMGHMFLEISDAHSKWLDVHSMTSLTFKKTITVLRNVFATHRLPQKVVTDDEFRLKTRYVPTVHGSKWNKIRYSRPVPSIYKRSC